jgi:hypothetical protein
LSLSLLFALGWGAVSSFRTPNNPITTHEIKVVSTSVVYPNPTHFKLETSVPNATLNAAEVSEAATAQAKFNEQHITYPTLPSSTLPGNAGAAYLSNIGWLYISVILFVLLIVASIFCTDRSNRSRCFFQTDKR